LIVLGVLDAVRSLTEAIDEFNDLQYLASTKGSSSVLVQLVAGAVLACFIILL